MLISFSLEVKLIYLFYVKVTRNEELIELRHLGPMSVGFDFHVDFLQSRSEVNLSVICTEIEKEKGN